MKHKAKTPAEALKLCAMMHAENVSCDIDLDHKTLRFANAEAWKRVRKRWSGMQVVRAAAESKIMMEEEGRFKIF